MADLFSLLQDLGDRIANKDSSSGSTQQEDDDPVESRFRAVLPTLLDAYFLPNKAKEREMMAILKLLKHTVRHFPGVLFHGKASAIMPIIGRIVPLLAEPTLSGSSFSDYVLETLESLLALLLSKEPQTFRKFVVDSMLLVQDLLSVASFFSTATSINGSTSVSVRCFLAAFSGLSEEELFCRAPFCCKDSSSPGLVIDVTGMPRWEPLAECVIKLLNRLLIEKSLMVQGLFSSPFFVAVGKITCYGSPSLHKACFELVRTATSLLDADIMPREKFILSILAIFAVNSDMLSAYRTDLYDSALGLCLYSLYATSRKEVVEFTAKAFIDIFASTLRSTSSCELKVALCNVLGVILKECPVYSRDLFSFLDLIFIPEIISQMSSCLEIALDIQVKFRNSDAPFIEEGNRVKRRRINSTGVMEKEVSPDFFESLLRITGVLATSSMPLDNVLAGYCVLARVFKNRRVDDLYGQVYKQFSSWLSSLCTQGFVAVSEHQIRLLLETVEGFLFSQGRDCIDPGFLEVVSEVLRLPWRDGGTGTMWAEKQLALSIITRARDPDVLKLDSILELGLRDEDVRVKSAAVSSVPLLLNLAKPDRVITISQLLRGLDIGQEQVREALAAVVGPICCICASKFSPSTVSVQIQQNLEVICSMCDEEAPRELLSEEHSRWSYIDHWAEVTFSLLFADCQSQPVLVRNIYRLASHSSEQQLTESKAMWVKCLEVLPVHQSRSVREAFASQIHCFIEERFWRCILTAGNAAESSNGGFEVLGKLRHAMLVTQDPEVVMTLMETIAEIAKSANGDQLRVFAVVLLIEHLDYRDMTVRVAAVHLINEVIALKWPLQGEIDSTRKGVFEYLCGRLVTRPVLVEEFAAAVLKVSKRSFLSQMIPIVLPKLVLEQQHDPKALETLNVLARELETTVPLLLLEWCHKVLSVLLLRADGKELMAALHFYESQTGSDPREIFAAVLPALLDELVRLLGDASSDEALRRSARVGPMIQEVARIVSGSDDLSSFLGRHFVGLLNSIDRKLLRSEDVGCQKQALRCIERLLDMIGPHLSAFVPKIMALLSQALQQHGLQSESFRVWLSFVKRLGDVCPTSLKSVASQIVVSLMPCLESDKDLAVTGAAEILEELVINRKGVLDSQLRQLPLLPSLPALAGINAILNHARGSLRLREQILRASDGLVHENLSLRYVTATELLKILGSRRSEILDMVLAETPSDADAVNRLVTALLRGCAEESRTSVSQKFKLACAECLGGLGAIDPVKLQVTLRHRSRMEHNDENFVFELINHHLTRVLRAASDTDVQDAAALAIQELLKLTGCKEARVSESRAAKNSKAKNKNQQEQLSSCGNSLWNRFSDGVKEIITPCLTSKYLLKNTGAAMPSGPIFRRGISFRRWMYLWTRRLLSQVTGRRSSIFAACQGVIRHDMDTALFLLPHLILDVLCNGSPEARSCITKEILTVLSESVSAGEVQDASQPVLINNTFFGHGEVSIQAIFMLLDNLGQWVDDFQGGAATIQSVQTSKSRTVTSSSAQLKGGSLQLHHVTQLLAAIPKQSLAGASFRSRAYARALLYYESYVREKSGALNPAASASGASFEEGDIQFLLKIYAGLDEPDGLSGLAQLQKRPTLQDQALINEKSGNWAEALTCCEQGLQMEPRSLFWQSGALNCLVNMGHFQAMVCHVDGLIARIPEHKRDWSIRGVQAAWRLGQWDLLDEYVQGAELENGAATAAYGTEADAPFDLSLAKVLQAFRSKDQFKLSEQLLHSRLALLAPLAAACMESYTRAYPFIVKLHMLRELEDFFSAPSEQMLELMETWNGRLKMTQPSLWIREPILALRRLLFTSAGMKSEIGACWLQYAKLCRSSGHYETANRAILQAEAAGSPNAHRERARLLWDTKKNHRAIDELQQYLTGVPLPVLGSASAAALGGLVHKLPTPTSVEERSSDKNNVAKALLLLGRWAHQTGQKQKEDVISIYLRVKDLRPTWEKGYFYMAKYSDDLLVDAKKRQEGLGSGKIAEESAWWNYLPDVILYYAKSLFRSHRHLFQALPRMLTLWFEFGSDMQQATGRRTSVHGRVMSIMKGCLKDLPSYHWVASLPQLVSRICHNDDEVVSLVKMIITTVLKTYPQQALWTMAAVSKSAVLERRDAAAACIHSAKSSDRNVFNQFTAFIDQMIRLCFIDVPDKVRTLRLSTSECSSLKRSMPLRVMVPVQRALTLTLPTDGLTTTNFNPFPDCPTIEAIQDEVQVLVSLQRPKRVVLVASDGTLHPFLCKPQDDLRKDARMMEFTTTINRLLAKDPRSRRRKLYIRTFAVIPLTENCGMVEWVPHTRGLRHIVQDLYAACGKFDRETTNNKIKDLFEKSKLSGGDLLRQEILPQFPPVFHKWFLNTFPEPTAWFQARLAYAHTAAVWSMVGHIVGLGDRHGENILCDSTTGDCVHVDFSCLFDRGLLLEKPEVVPFRLTQNVVDGLGITGYEGAFLRTCELTLSILRSHRETLMSILETFIHDPLVEWTKSHKLSGTEVENPHAQRALANIEARLRGVVVGVGAAPSLPLSVEGQAHRLISEAVCVDNLGRMYIWWMAWF